MIEIKIIIERGREREKVSSPHYVSLQVKSVTTVAQVGPFASRLANPGELHIHSIMGF